jgi:hypothetical protein
LPYAGNHLKFVRIVIINQTIYTMPKVNHKLNRDLINKLGGEKGVNEFKKKYPNWIAYSKGVDRTLLRMKIKAAHGKASAREDAKRFNVSVNTIYSARNSRD